MDIRRHIDIDIKFEDVPDECKIQTYLNSQATVLNYNKDKCTIWDEYNKVREVFTVHLNADEEELVMCKTLLVNYIQNIKHEKQIPTCMAKFLCNTLTNYTAEWNSYINIVSEGDEEYFVLPYE